MHIHGNHMQLQAANFQSAAATQKAAAARQAADVRGRLMNSSLEMDSEVSPEASWMLGRWPQGSSRGQQGQYQSDSSASAESGADDAGQTDAPVSVWA
ncbi:MAG TPA: hypothetical protein VMF56_01065 [Acidobacteriaceae bacterium]|nr:hypothetical protein [Acidobacteriaceae bacterium]